ncbi:hypothetical protein SD71_04165 [Cohnella kolymensis]|uniref:ATP-grasp domain-containing protein n=1 Tax=Cohnella kolymensis TaxID=1590652 RepID=A0ABR5A7S0_9BACL|nr:hypothetical protein SD71_04165 [Cohnella kolymensis]
MWDPSKWELHKLYSKHPDIGRLVPPTEVLSLKTLKRLLHDYKKVYIKGKNSHTGSGIIKAWKTGTGYRFVRVKGKPVDVPSIAELYTNVKRGRPDNSVIVQKAIDLAKVEGRPFSIRLMMMRDGQRKWHYTGMLAKVSGEDSIITNVRRGGGYATTIDEALAKSLGYSRQQIAKVKRKLVRIGFDIIDHSIKRGYLSHESGLDLGIDRKGKVWIIEVNLCYPSYGIFNRLEDKTFYNKIKRLAADYKKNR